MTAPGGASRPGSPARAGGTGRRRGGHPAAGPAAVISDPAPVPPPPPRKELISGSSSGGASYASTAPRWQSTKSPRSGTWGSRGLASQRGQPSWQECGARPLSSARRAMTTSTPTPSRTRHKSLESPVQRKPHAGFGGRLRGKGLGSRSCEPGTSPRSPPYPAMS